jgi:hypothetical protein
MTRRIGFPPEVAFVKRRIIPIFAKVAEKILVFAAKIVFRIVLGPDFALDEEEVGSSGNRTAVHYAP